MAAGAAIDACLADHLALREDHLGLKRGEPPLHHPARLFHPFLVTGKSPHGEEKPRSFALCRSDERETCAFRIAGSKPVYAEIEREQRVLVALKDLVPGKVRLGIERVVLRICLLKVPREFHHVAGGGPAFGRRKARRIAECRARKPQILGARVHARREFGLGAGQSFCQNDAGVVGILDDHAPDQVVDLHLRFQRRKHGRSAGRRATGAPGELGYGIAGFGCDLAALERAEHHFHGHQLGERGCRKRLVFVCRKQHRAGLFLDHIDLSGLGREGWCGVLRRHGLCRGKGCRDAQAGRKQKASHHAPRNVSTYAYSIDPRTGINFRR